jgi:uncharacterized protein YbaR (Trm112 family)/SAM-dependent methyltransferase
MSASPHALTTVQELLCCPVCKAKLQCAGAEYACTNAACGSHFPLVQGVPILVNEANSLLSIASFVNAKPPEATKQAPKIQHVVERLLPTISHNVKARQNYAQFMRLLLERNPTPTVLVIGGGEIGAGMDGLLTHPAITVVETDVYLSPRTGLICDAHDIPFAPEAFDAVVVQAVLEHVVDPYRCVAEIYRVLKPCGLVYAEIPFMQQVHMAQFDFTRFTHLGLRRLFRHFEEVSSGAVGGPGMALAWSYQYFLLSFAKRRYIRALLRVFGTLTSFYLKYFDYYLIDKPGTFDAAAGYYFLGKKSDLVLSDHAVIASYRGGQERRTLA